jgi:hypothetical protein
MNPHEIIQPWIDQEYGVMEFGRDLNGDGIDELFVGSTADSNTGGDLFHIYEKLAVGWHYLGAIHLMRYHVDTSPLPGFRDIHVYVREGCGGCTIGRYEWNGRSYVENHVKYYDFTKGEHPDPEVQKWEFGATMPHQNKGRTSSESTR